MRPLPWSAPRRSGRCRAARRRRERAGAPGPTPPPGAGAQQVAVGSESHQARRRGGRRPRSRRPSSVASAAGHAGTGPLAGTCPAPLDVAVGAVTAHHGVLGDGGEKAAAGTDPSAVTRPVTVACAVPCRPGRVSTRPRGEVVDKRPPPRDTGEDAGHRARGQRQAPLTSACAPPTATRASSPRRAVTPSGRRPRRGRRAGRVGSISFRWSRRRHRGARCSRRDAPRASAIARSSRARRGDRHGPAQRLRVGAAKRPPRR